MAFAFADWWIEKRIQYCLSLQNDWDFIEKPYLERKPLHMDVARWILMDLVPRRADLLLQQYKAWKATDEVLAKKKSNIHLVKASPRKPVGTHPDLKVSYRRLEEHYRGWESAESDTERVAFEHMLADDRIALELRLCHSDRNRRSWLLAFFQFCGLNIRTVRDLARRLLPPEATLTQPQGMTLSALGQQLFDLGFYIQAREVVQATDVSELIRIF